MISLPTSKALRSTFILGSWSTPFISRASVIAIPLNPYSSLRRLFTVLYDKDDGYTLSKAGTLRWANITDSANPSSISLLNGYSSTLFNLLMSPFITGNVSWESLSVSPWPGKCLIDVNMPASLWPWI